MKLILIGITMLGSLYGFGQLNGIQWGKSFGGDAEDKSYCIRQTADGGYIVAGSSASANGDVTLAHGGHDGWLLKMSSLGVIQWQKALGGTGEDDLSEIRQTTDGGYIVVGSTSSTDGDVSLNYGLSDYWILKLNSSGTIQWQQVYGGTSVDKATCVSQTADGGYIVGGASYSTDGYVSGNHGDDDAWVLKLDSLGAIQWKKALGGSDPDFASSVSQTLDGGYLVAATTVSSNGDVTGNHGSVDLWLVKLTSSGTLSWEKSYGGSNMDACNSAFQTSDGGYIMAGYTSSSDGDVTTLNGGRDYWVVKVNSAGNIQWQRTYGGTDIDEAKSIQPTADGGYIVAGDAYSTNGDVGAIQGAGDYWILKITATGLIQWKKAIGGTGDNVTSYGIDEAYSIQQTTDGGYIVCGYSDSKGGDVTGNHGAEDYWVVKLSTIEGIETMTLKDRCTIYPVPAGNILNVRLKDFKAPVLFTLYDVMGNSILSGSLTQQASELPLYKIEPGIYFFHLNGMEGPDFKIIRE